jgi:hypothetical protein
MSYVVTGVKEIYMHGDCFIDLIILLITLNPYNILLCKKTDLTGFSRDKLFWGFYGSSRCHEEKHSQNLALALPGMNQ